MFQQVLVGYYLASYTLVGQLAFQHKKDAYYKGKLILPATFHHDPLMRLYITVAAPLVFPFCIYLWSQGVVIDNDSIRRIVRTANYGYY